MIIFELINILFSLTILLGTSKIFNIPTQFTLILLMHLFCVYFINIELIDPSYMPDQFAYFHIAENIRLLNFFDQENFTYGLAVYTASLFFGLFPIPYIVSINSIANINFLLYLLLFIFLFQRNFFLSRSMIYFYLLYPSLLLYTSLALRDILIFMLMFFGIYFLLVKQNFILTGLNLLILGLLKFQNLLIMSLAYFIQIFINQSIKISHLAFSVIILLTIIVFYSDYFSIVTLNHYRLSFYNENISSINIPYTPILSYEDMIKTFIPSIFYFLFRPLPWEENSFFHLIQFTENLFISIIIIYILLQQLKHRLFQFQEFKFLNMLLLFSLIIYGSVIFNSGTGVRYKFPFIGIYILYGMYFINQYKISILESKNNALNQSASK